VVCVLAGALGDAAAVVSRAFERALHPRVERVIGGLERDQQLRFGAVAGAGGHRFVRVEEAAVGRVQARLGDRAGGGRRLREVVEGDGRRTRGTSGGPAGASRLRR
jgi:hypothetical protein